MRCLPILPAVAGLLVASAASARADDIPGGPGTTTTLALGATLDSDLGSPTDSDWLRTSLRAGQLYAFTVSTYAGEWVGFRLTARDAAGRVLATADVPPIRDWEIVQLNFRPRADGPHYLEVQLAQEQPPGVLGAPYMVGLRRDVSSSFEDAVRLPFNTRVTGRSESLNDTDYFVVRLEKGQPVDVLSPIMWDNDNVLLRDRDGEVIDRVDAGFGKLAHHVPTYTGDHYVSVYLYQGSGYTLRVAPADRGRPTPGSDLLIGTNGPDAIDALAGNDLVRGLAGNDLLLGGPGDDTVHGGPGRDRVKGAAGFDNLFGEDGDDVVTGGPGQDHLDGGPGQDRFLFFGDAARGYDSGSRSDPDPYQQGLDRVHGFAAGDKIDLRGVDADAALAGRQGFTFIGTAPFTGPGQVRYGFDTEDGSPRTVIALNTDADPAPEMEIQLEERVALRAGDLTLRDPPRRPADMARDGR